MSVLVMTTFPSKPDSISDPYTNNEGEHCMKPRLVYCKNCKYTVVTDMPGAKCGECKKFLITMLSRHELA